MEVPPILSKFQEPCHKGNYLRYLIYIIKFLQHTIGYLTASKVARSSPVQPEGLQMYLLIFTVYCNGYVQSRNIFKPMLDVTCHTWPSYYKPGVTECSLMSPESS